MVPSDPLVLLLLAGAVVLALVVALSFRALRVGTATPTEISRGLRNGLLIALLLMATVAVITTLLTAGRPFLFGTTASLEGAVLLGLLLGGLVGGGYLAIGALVMVLGLSLRHSATWATRESWLVAPVVVVLGLAAVGFANGVDELANRPMTRAGTVELRIEGVGIGQLQGQGQARCTLDDDNLAVHAGGGEGGALAASDGTPMMVQLGLLANGQPRLIAGVGGLEAHDDRSPSVNLRLDGASGTRAGTLHFSGLAPLEADGEPDQAAEWSGSVAWQCSF